MESRRQRVVKRKPVLGAGKALLVDVAIAIALFLLLPLPLFYAPSFREGTGSALAADTTWTIQVVDSAGDVGHSTSLAFDSSGYPAISYYDRSNTDLKFARWTGSAWSRQTVDSADAVGYDSSLAFDSSGYPAISYHDASNQDLKFARWTGSAWSLQTVDSSGEVGWYTSLALDSSGYPAISYYDNTSRDLKFARWTGSAWSRQTVDSAGDVGHSTSLAFDPSGYPAISYNDNTNGDLKFARWTGSAWSRQTVDSAGDVGDYTSLAFDSSGYPAISYYDSFNGDLKFARWTGSAWSLQTVDSSGEVGWSTSLAFDSSGNPAISYYDYTNRDPKFAFADVTSPSTPSLSSPADGGKANDTTPYLDWSDVTDPSGATYSLQVDDNSDFSSPAISQTGLTPSTYTPASALAEGTYYWRVKAVDGAGYDSGWTASWSFAIDTTVPSVPSLLSPITGAKANNTTPYLDWSDVSDLSGASYRLQIDDAWDFSTPLLTPTGLSSSLYALSAGEALEEGVYYWRVRAIDGAGNESPWSGAWSFTVDIIDTPPSTVQTTAGKGVLDTLSGRVLLAGAVPLLAMLLAVFRERIAYLLSTPERRRKRLRAQYQRKLERWRKKGYNVTGLEEKMEDLFSREE